MPASGSSHKFCEFLNFLSKIKQMNNTKRLAVIITASIVVLIATFYLGYLAGGQGHKTQPGMSSPLTSRDMEHAFGNVNVPELETINPQPAATSLSSLVAGLEKKVAANPENIDQQLLLAQTYNELDNRAKSLKLLRALNKKSSGNPQVKITLATILMKETDRQELKEAHQLFDEAIQLNPEITKMARLYQEEIKVKLGKSNR